MEKIRRGNVPSSSRRLRRPAGLVAAFSCTFLLNSVGNGLESNWATSLGCLAILLLGLPHGSLDLAVMRKRTGVNEQQIAAIIMIYLGFAGSMALVWHIAPVGALAVFLAIACVHFAEDWLPDQLPFFAIGTATAVLTAPALLHYRQLSDIFVKLTGNATASMLADFTLLVAPVALITAIVGITLACRQGRSIAAIESATILCSMVLLPPVIGFAVFFCLAHSPRHFAAAKAELSFGSRRLNCEIGLLTFAAMGIAALIYIFRNSGLQGDGVIAASFVTLSILTVPHMIVPRFFL